VDWAPILALAGLDRAALTAADPHWNWLAAADTRVAWTGTWPGSSLPLRVEAASLRGRPVAFMTMGPWTRPWRTSSASSGKEIALVAVLFLLAFGILAGGLLLARKNLREGRGDRSGAAVLGCSLAAVLLLLWACRVHVVASMGLPAMFLIAVCTAVFYGVLFWAIYLAVEPFLRRHWPQTLVSWTTLLGGRVRDRVVGRDVLVGVALGVAIAALVRVADFIGGEQVWPSIDLLLGTRSTIGEILTRIVYAARTGIFIVFLLVMLRVLFRSQWTAAIAFVVLLTAVNILGSDDMVSDGLISLLYFSMFAATILKWGFTSLTVGLVIGDLLIIIPAGTDLSAWYAGQTALLIAFPLALAAWAVSTSTGGGRNAARGQ
jgi:hypothetical protein